MAEYDWTSQPPEPVEVQFYGRGICIDLLADQASLTKAALSRAMAEALDRAVLTRFVDDGSAERQRAWAEAHPWRVRGQRIRWWLGEYRARLRLAWRVLRDGGWEE